MCPFHPDHEVCGQTQQTAEIVVDQPHIHALRGLAAKDLLDAVPHISMAHDEKFQKDGLFCFFQISQKLGIHRFATVEILRGGVVPCWVGAVFCHIAALPHDTGVQTVGHAWGLSQIFFVGGVHGLHFQAATACGPLVAESQIQRSAQQRQNTDECDPADLIGTVFVFAHEVQHDDHAQCVEQAVDPYAAGAGGYGIAHPCQPQELQCDQHHRDGNSVDDPAEESDDRRAEKHDLHPFLLL